MLIQITIIFEWVHNPPKDLSAHTWSFPWTRTTSEKWVSKKRLPYSKSAGINFPTRKKINWDQKQNKSGMSTKKKKKLGKLRTERSQQRKNERMLRVSPSLRKRKVSRAKATRVRRSHLLRKLKPPSRKESQQESPRNDSLHLHLTFTYFINRQKWQIQSHKILNKENWFTQ